MPLPTKLTIALMGLLVSSLPAVAEDLPRGARINNLKVLSDKVDDVTTIENIVHSFVKQGMTDQERSKALWHAIVKYRHQTVPPNEYLAADWEAHDPVKIFNVYGYCMCCCCSALVEALNRADGREARGRILTGHSVPEVRYGDGWHMFDTSLINLFPKPGSGVLASVDEITAASAAWYAEHPEYKGNEEKLVELMRSEGWSGWKTSGPALLANCPYFDKGFFPARTHGWNDTMVEYDRKSEVYEYGYHVGHRALFSLRPGESFVREAGNRGLHVSRDQLPDWEALKARAPLNDLVYVNDFFPGYRGGIVANGIHRYAPDLDSNALAAGAEVYDNLATGGSPALHLKTGGKPGIAVVAMTSPYVYLCGRLKLKALRGSDADRLIVSISTNNGRSFEPVWTADSAGSCTADVDLSDKILRRYSYLLRFEIMSAAPGRTGLDAFEVENDIQHAPRTLPWLGQGRNTITVAADSDMGLASRTIACRITPDTRFTKNETTQTMGVTFENLDVRDGSCWWTQGIGRMTVPIELPGDLVALHWSAQVRARGVKDLVKMLVSADDGKTWSNAGRIEGPTPGTTGYFQHDRSPVGTRKALLRFELSGNNTVGILSFRVDADYRDPLAALEFRPFQVIHRWTENSLPKSRIETIARLPFTYTINAGSDPEMVSVDYVMPSRR